MPGDVKNPLGGMKGYQFWAIVGMLTIVVPRILLAYDIPLGLLTATLWENTELQILLNDAIGALIVVNSYYTYADFVDRATA